MCTPLPPDPASVDALPPSRASFSVVADTDRRLYHSRPRFRRARMCARVFLRHLSLLLDESGRIAR